MRQIVLERPQSIVMRDAPTPTPRPGDALVRSEQVGICGSDLHAYHGKHPFITLPVVPGHEVVGTVEALGEVAHRRRPSATGSCSSRTSSAATVSTATPAATTSARS